MRAAVLAVLWAASAAAAPSRWTGAFPCDPAKLEWKPQLLLLGESHEDEFSASVKKAVIDGGVRGAFYAACEPSGEGPMTPEVARELVRRSGRPAEKARLYGLEGSPATTFASLYLHTSREAPVWTTDLVRYTLSLLDLMKNDPPTRRVFEAALKGGRIADPLQRRVVKTALAAREPSSALQKSEEFMALYQAAAKAREEAAEEVRREYDQAAVDELLSRLGRDADSADVKLGTLMELRDRDFALQAASLYCSAARERLNLAVLVGALHAPGVRDFLRRWAPRLEVRTLDTDGRKGAHEAHAALRSWEAAPPAPPRGPAEPSLLRELRRDAAPSPGAF